MTEEEHAEPRRVPPIVLVGAVLLVLLGAAYWVHHAAVTNTVEALYAGILSAPLELPQKYPTETARLERSEKLVFLWRSLDGPVIDLEAVGADLPLPLRLARTFQINNPEDLKKRAGGIFARNLEALSARHAPAATPSAWESEIASWRAVLRR